MDKLKIAKIVRNMKPHEKSEILVEAAGWTVIPAFEGSTQWTLVNSRGKILLDIDYVGRDKPKINLYRETNMGLAWSIHIWALGHVPAYYDWYLDSEILVYVDAQNRWLDGILRLGIYEEVISLEGYDIGLSQKE